MSMPNLETGLITRTSIPALVAAWNESIDEIKTGLALLVQAEERLRSVFGDHKHGFRITGSYNNPVDLTKPDDVVKAMKMDAWRVLVDRLELRRVMSTKRAEAMDRQLNGNADEPMPDITVESLNGILLGMLDQVPQFMDEAVQETLSYLMPNRQHYVSTSPFVIGKKVVLTYAVDWGYSRRWTVSYHSRDRLRGLDNTFHMLDGKGSVLSHRGPLVDAIEAADHDDPVIETVYFKCRAFKNRNLHVEFKRQDLVDKLNQIAADNKLADPTKRRTA